MKLKQIQLANKVKIPQDLLSFLIDHRRIETNKDDQESKFSLSAEEQ